VIGSTGDLSHFFTRTYRDRGLRDEQLPHFRPGEDLGSRRIWAAPAGGGTGNVARLSGRQRGLSAGLN